MSTLARPIVLLATSGGLHPYTKYECAKDIVQFVDKVWGESFIVQDVYGERHGEEDLLHACFSLALLAVLDGRWEIAQRACAVLIAMSGDLQAQPAA